jgi:drug/metabolite transporter (DMT)-like permease
VSTDTWAQLSSDAFSVAFFAYLLGMLAAFHYLAFRRRPAWVVSVAAAGLGLGDLFAAAAGFFYGAYYLAAGRVRAILDSPTVMTLATAAGAALLLPVALLLRAPLWGYAPSQWLALLGLGIVSQLGGVWLINYALGHLPTALVSVTALAQPVLVALLGLALLGEGLEPGQILGGTLVVAGIYLVHRLGRY